jgi:peptide subunit release factor 1 (eRF1)
MTVRERVVRLSRITSARHPVVSAYLDTHWSDEHQRERARTFMRQALREARAQHRDDGIGDDLDWLEAEAARVIDQARMPDAHGVVFFACAAIGLREIVPVRVPFANALFVGEHPVLTPLAAMIEAAPPALVLFVDGGSARLIPLETGGRGEELVLEHAVEGRHRRGGWALLAQSRYERHIARHRAEHFDAVVAALTQLTATQPVDTIVLAGEARTLAAFRTHLPSGLDARVAGAIVASRHEPAASLVERAMCHVAAVRHARDGDDIRVLVTEAAKGGRAVTGLDATVAAVARGAVHRLFIMRDFRATGAACSACGALEPRACVACGLCGAATRHVPLEQVLVERVLAAGGAVDVVEQDPDLAGVGGVAARLRYFLGGAA